MVHCLKKLKFNNCFCALLGLLITRRVRKLFVLKWSGLFPHFAGITEKGNLIHFKTNRRYDYLKPLIFQGQFEIRRWKKN